LEGIFGPTFPEGPGLVVKEVDVDHQSRSLHGLSAPCRRLARRSRPGSGPRRKALTCPFDIWSKKHHPEAVCGVSLAARHTKSSSLVASLHTWPSGSLSCTWEVSAQFKLLDLWFGVYFSVVVFQRSYPHARVRVAVRMWEEKDHRSVESLNRGAHPAGRSRRLGQSHVFPAELDDGHGPDVSGFPRMLGPSMGKGLSLLCPVSRLGIGRITCRHGLCGVR